MTETISRVRMLALAALLAAALASSATAQTAPSIYAVLDKGVYALVVKITVKPGQVDKFLEVMKARIADSRVNPSVVDFRILSSSDPLVFYGFESFVNKAEFETFARDANSAAFLEAVRDILAQRLEVQFLQPMP